MAALAPATAPAPTKRRSSTGLKAKIQEQYDLKLKAARGRVAKLAESQTAAEGAGAVGAAVAGGLAGYGVALDIGETEVPMALPVGAVAYVLGRKSKSAMLRGAGHGMVCGGIALVVRDLTDGM